MVAIICFACARSWVSSCRSIFLADTQSLLITLDHSPSTELPDTHCSEGHTYRPSTCILHNRILSRSEGRVKLTKSSKNFVKLICRTEELLTCACISPQAGRLQNLCGADLYNFF